MELKKIYTETEDKMKKAIDAIKKDFAVIRTGKASTALLDGIKVDYYGNPTPLAQVANIAAPDPRLLVIQPWEKKMIPEIIKAVQKADLGLNPQSDANVIRLPIPPLNEERRKDLVKLVKKGSEDGKVELRNIRRDSNEALKKAEKSKTISEDDSRKGLEHVQKITEDYIAKIEELMEKKEKEIMEI